MKPKAEIDPEIERKDRACCGCIVAIAVALASVVLFVQRCSNPPEMVTITLQSVPNNAEYAFFVADRAEGLVRLPWYVNLGPYGYEIATQDATRTKSYARLDPNN